MAHSLVAFHEHHRQQPPSHGSVALIFYETKNPISNFPIGRLDAKAQTSPLEILFFSFSTTRPTGRSSKPDPSCWKHLLFFINKSRCTLPTGAVWNDHNHQIPFTEMNQNSKVQNQVQEAYVVDSQPTPIAQAVPVSSQPNSNRSLTTNGTSPFVYQKPRSLTSASRGSNKWKHDLCGCCDLCSCCCFVNEILLFPFGSAAIYSSAVAASGIDPDQFFSNNQSLREDQCCRCCAIFCAICCEVVPCQSVMVRTIVRLHVAHKYEIGESLSNAAICTCCCALCSDFQVQNEIMTQENLTYGCCQVVPIPKQ